MPQKKRKIFLFCKHLHPEMRARLCERKYACCQTHACELIANNGCQLGSRCSRRHDEALVESRSRDKQQMSELKRKTAPPRRQDATFLIRKPAILLLLRVSFCALSTENDQEKSAVGASKPFSFTLNLSILFSCFPLCLSHFSPRSLCCTVYALYSCKSTIISTVFLLCGAHGKDNCYRPIFSMELCK